MRHSERQLDRFRNGVNQCHEDRRAEDYFLPHPLAESFRPLIEHCPNGIDVGDLELCDASTGDSLYLLIVWGERPHRAEHDGLDAAFD